MTYLDRADRSWQPVAHLPFFPSPIEPGLYLVGTVLDQNTFIVCPNNRRYIKELSEIDAQIIAIPCGGLDLETALAFETINLNAVVAVINSVLPANTPTRLLIPSPLFELLRNAGQNFGESEMISVSSAAQEIIYFIQNKSVGTKPARANLFMAQMRWAFLFGVGQTFLLSIALALFGVSVWLTGLLFFWIALAATAFSWKWTPIKPFWLRGLIIGTALAVVTVIFQFFLGNSNWQTPLGIWILSIWIGAAITGTNKS
jgi:hypothetical protein